MKKREVEILAPAGTYESMTAAVNAGADAVYLGGSRFGARAYAGNLDQETMVKAIDYVHLSGRRLYMTVNTLVKEKELPELYEFLAPYYEAGLDGVIVQDLGVFRYIREQFPELPLHISTQMTVTGKDSAEMLKEMGAVRVVPARELSIPELREMYERTGMEIETFVHGALCYCYSGQCLFSSLIGGRSGNRGRCAQPCRLPFEVRSSEKKLTKKNENYVLSLKDLCTLDILPDILDAGVCSLKIEGRMKSPRYTAGVVSIYRKYVDMYLEKGRKGYHVDERDRKALLELFDRGGQSSGYYKQHNGRDMVVLKEKPAFRETDQEFFDFLDRTYVNAERKIPVRGEADFKAGCPSRLTVTAGKEDPVTVILEGAVAEQASRQPMTDEKIRKQLTKTGGSSFEFEDLAIHIDGDVFIPVQELNRLRREALDELKEKIQAGYHRAPVKEKKIKAPEKKKDTAQPELTFLVNTRDQLDAVLSECAKMEYDDYGIYLASESFDAEDWKKDVEKIHSQGIHAYLMLPRIFRTRAEKYFMDNMTKLKDAGFDAIGAGSMEEPAFFHRHTPEIPQYFDHGMYVFNHLAEETMKEMGADRITIPVELNRHEIEDTGVRGEMLIYGYLPMMISAQCIKKTTDHCTGRPEILYLKDRKGKELPVVNQCRFCYNTIYNESPLSLLGLRKEILGLSQKALRLQFSVESKEETLHVLRDFLGEYVYHEDPGIPSGNFTRGHYKRGVE